MSKVSRRRLAQVLLRLLKQQPAKRQQIVQSVAAFLVERKQAKQLPLLMNDVAQELEKEGQLTATVTSAHKLTPATHKQLSDYLQAATNARQVKIVERIDAELLSGVVVRTADKELDTTARRALRQLASLTTGRK